MDGRTELLLYTFIVPMLVAAAAAWFASRLLPVPIAERYSLGVALAAGFGVGYWLLPEWAHLVPTKHWQWLPYLAAAAVLGGLAVAGGVTWPERLVANAALALVAAWQLVPLWEELQPPRHYAVPLLAGYLFLLAALLSALPDRLLGPLFVGLLAVSSGTVAVLIAIGVSLIYGQVAGVAGAALCGCWLASLLSALTRNVSANDTGIRSQCIRGLIPVYAVLVGGLAFVGTIEPTPPMTIFLLAPAAPLMLWLFSAGPLGRLRGLPAAAAQIAAVLIPLAIALAIVVIGHGGLGGEEEWSRGKAGEILESAVTAGYIGGGI
jgi:hypothetical protein